MAYVPELLAWALIAAVVIFTAAPLSRIPHGAVRSLAFPRLQVLGVAVALALALPFVLGGAALWVGLILLVLVIGLQGASIARFTPLWHRQSAAADPELQADRQRQVTLLAANVKMSNRAYHRLIELVQAEDPDLLMAVETDRPWIEALAELRPGFTHHVEVPHANGYGMILYSRFPLEEPQVRELLIEKIPSIRTAVRLPSGAVFRLYVVHPEPPVPYQNSHGRDAEIGVVGIEAKKDELPAIVAGDLNDVAWSFTTRRFQRLSGLLDPRVGRGFYNTFDARYPFLRWPLDHLFHDPDFRLVDMRRLAPIGSDHFPMLFKLAYAGAPGGDRPETCDAEEKKEIEDMARDEAKSDREAIGSHWEDD